MKAVLLSMRPVEITRPPQGCRVVRLGDLKEKRDLIMSKSNLQTTHAERETGKPLLSTVTMANLKYLKWNKQPSTCSLCK